MFHFENFRNVTLDDAEKLIPRLTASNANSCELPFSNLYAWGFSCGTRWQEYNGHLYFFFGDIHGIVFVDTDNIAGNPSPSELAEVLTEIRRYHADAEFFLIRKAFADAHPELKLFFTIEPMDDGDDEYIYSVRSLVELSGEKLRKKRNLIRQFLKQVPEPRVEAVAQGKVLDDCLALAAEWRAEQEIPDSDEIKWEADALSHLTDGFSRIGCEGVAVYAENTLVSFAIYARISKDMFTESFEKSRAGFKGAAQFANHEMAKRLDGRCLYINREQDLGLEGLRHAKLSYDPILLLKNYRLTLR